MKDRKKALITGVTGQDGAYLSKFLLAKGYEVHGIKRRSSVFNTSRIDDIYEDPHSEDKRFFLHYGNLADSTNLIRIVQEVQPDEIYNLGAMSHVQVSFEEPEYTADIDGIGTLRILEAIRILKKEKSIKVYQASTSELFGKATEVPQNEKTPFYPRSPYAVAKLYAYWITVNYREAYDIFACNGILFNHESPLRGETFVTRKITRAAAKISLGLQKTVYLGNLDAKRDWGHAKDYVALMWKIMQYKEPSDWVIATGVTTSVRDFVRLSFAYLNIEIEFIGKGKDEVGYVKSLDNSYTHLEIGSPIVRVDPHYYRPTEVDLLIGDASKARTLLDWAPDYTVESLCAEMVQADLELFNKQNVLKEKGFEIKNEFE